MSELEGRRRRSGVTSPADIWRARDAGQGTCAGPSSLIKWLRRRLPSQVAWESENANLQISAKVDAPGCVNAAGKVGQR